MRTLALAFLLTAPVQAFARAGGAGGGSFSSGGGGYGGGGYGGGGGDGGAIVDLIIFLLRAGPIGWLILGAIAVAAYYYLNANSLASTYAADPARSAPIAAAAQSNAAQFAQSFQGEDVNKFLGKVSTAFLTIQRSWSEKNIAHMRRFISDGVAQRFNAQFLMMNLLEQTNPVTEVQVHSVQIAKIMRDGAYDCVDVMIHASATDQFVCRKFPQLNSPGGHEPFTEFWTFIRRTDFRPGKDIYSSQNCPQCGAPLNEKLVETARCPYCGSHLNSGEFDWVLAEITQDNDYKMPMPMKSALTPPDLGVGAVRKLDPGFSVNVLEDKAANAFMEVLIGNATGQAALVKRFTTENAFAEIERTRPKTRFVYDRLYTRAVGLLRAEAGESRARAYVGVRYSCNLVDLAHPQAPDIDADQFSVVTVLAMTRDYSDGQAKGSVYAGTCPHCGAPQKDNLNPLCDHCGQQLNDEKYDWIVDAVLDPTQYRALDKTLEAAAQTK